MTSQTAFNRTMLQASPAAQNLVASYNGAKVSEQQLSVATKEVTLSVKAGTTAMKVFSVALNTIAYMAVIKGIQLLISGLDNLANAAKIASEKADDLYNNTNEKVQKNEEEIKSLEDLISKYKELKESDNLDIDTRKEIREIQNQIADLVGTQSANLDLVNGKLDEELKKLQDINAEESKRAYQNAFVNYYNAKDSGNKAIGDSKVFFEDYDYSGKIETEAKKILEKAGFGVYSTDIHGNKSKRLANPSYGGFGQDGFMNSKLVVKAIGETAKEKYDYLQQLISVLEQYGQRDTDIYKGLMSQAAKYDQYVQNQQNAANSLVDSWITYSQFSNDTLSKITVDSVESFEQYRQKMIEEAKKDQSIGEILADNTLSENDLKVAIDNFMATTDKFSEWYEKWKDNIESITEDISATSTTFKQAWSNLDDPEDDNLKNTKKDLLELAEAGQLTVKSFKQIEGAKSYFENLGIPIDKAIDKINNLVTASDQLSSMKSGVSSISNALWEKKSNLSDKKTADQGIASDTLAGFDATIKGLDSWETFEKVLGNGSSSMEQCKKAANALATEWVNSNNFLSQLNETNKDYYISALKDMGVTNAENVVQKALTATIVKEKAALEEATVISKKNSDAKQIGIEKTKDLENATISEIGSLIEYGKKTGTATTELQKLMDKKILAATYNAISNDDFKALEKYCVLLGIAQEELANLKSARAAKKSAKESIASAKEYDTQYIGVSAEGFYKNSLDNAKEEENKAKKNFVKEVKKRLASVKDMDISVGKTSEQKEKDDKEKSKSKNKASKFSQEIDWTTQAITTLQQKIDDLNTKLQNTEGYDAQHKLLQQLIKDQKELANAYSLQANAYQNEYQKSIKGLNKSDIHKIENGAYTIQTFKGKAKSGKKSGAEKYYNQLQEAIEAYNNYQDALSNVKSTKAEATATRIEDWENYSSKLSTKADTKSDKLNNATGYKQKKRLIQEIADLNVKDLDTQIKIAKIKQDTITVQNLQQQKKSIELQKEQDLLQLDVDRYEQLANTYSAQYALALTAEEQNELIDKQIKNTKELYKTKIAMLDKDTQSKEILELKAQKEKELKEYADQKVDNLIEEINVQKEYNDTLKESSGHYKDKNAYIDELIKLSNEEYELEISKLDPEKQSADILALQAKQAREIADYTKEKLENERDYLAVLKQGLEAQLNSSNSLNGKLKLNQNITNNEIKDLLLQYEAAQTKEEKDTLIAQIRERAAENELSEAELISQWFENQRQATDHTKNLIDKLISFNEINGYTASSVLVQEQIALEQKRVESLQKENEELKKSLNNIEPYSDAWYEIEEKIYQSTENLYEAQNTLAECEKTLREIEKLKFDNILNSMSLVIEESDFLIDLIDKKDMFDSEALDDAISSYILAGKERISKGITEISQAEKEALKEIESAGKMTNEGKAVMGQHVYNYEVYIQQSEKYLKEIERINQELTKDSNKANTELIKQKQEYEQAQRQAILNAEKEKETVVSYLQDALDKELDATNSLIDAKIELLDAEKALHDYRKSIADTSASIALLEKKIAALEGDTSEEAMAKIQELKAELKEKMDELADDEYDRMIEVQKQALEDEKSANKSATDVMRRDTEKLWNDAVKIVTLDSNQILSTITTTAKNVNYQLSVYITEAWKEVSNKTVLAGTAADNYGTSIFNLESSIRTQMENIVSYWNNVASAANAAAQAQLDAANASVEADTITTTHYAQGNTLANAEMNTGTSTAGTDYWEEDPRAAYSKRAMTQSILQTANGKGAGTSNLNQYLGTNLSYEQMATLGGLYGVSANPNDYNSKKSEQAVENKNLLLEKLKNAGFSKGGVIEEDVSSIVKANGDNTLISARVGEGIVSEKSMSYLREMIGDVKETANGLVNFKDTALYKKFQSGEMYKNIDMSAMIPNYIAQPETTAKCENIYYGSNVTVEQNITVEGSLDENVLPEMKKMMISVADERIKRNWKQQNHALRSLGRH